MINYKLPSCSEAEREAAVGEFRQVAAEKRRLALRGARAVLELERTGAHFQAGAASIAHFAEMNGMAAYEARELVNLGHALEATGPIDGGLVEARVTTGAIPVASAAVLGEVSAAPEPDFVRSDDRWIEWAETKSTRDFRRLFARRRDEVRSGESVTPVTAYVTARVLDDLERARTLVSRKAHAPLTMGQTLGIIVDDWLADHDPLRTTPGTRRLPDTSMLPGERYVPAEVDREVRARSEDRCMVPLCDSGTWVHRSHRVAHRDGGSREAAQLDLLCDYHHRLYEGGSLRIEGPADAPIFTDANGRRIDERMPFVVDGLPPAAGSGTPEASAADRHPPNGEPSSNSEDRRSRRSPLAGDGPGPPRT